MRTIPPKAHTRPVASVTVILVLAFLWMFYPLMFAQAPSSNPADAQAVNPAIAKALKLADAQAVIGYLNQSIGWQHQIVVEEQIATDPSDLLVVTDDRQTANAILRLSFDFARANAQLLAAQGAPDAVAEDADASGRHEVLVRAATAAAAEVGQTQSELDSDKSELETARGRERKRLQAAIDELEGELALARERSKMLTNILQFVSGPSAIGGNLSAQIDQLQRSVPELEADAAKGAAGQANSPAAALGARLQDRRSQPAGILVLVEDLFSLSRQINTLDQRMQSTDELSQAAQKLRAPLLANVTTIAQQGAEAAKQADVSSPAQLEQLKRQFDTLTAQFKQLSSVGLPLSKQALLFDLYKGNLARWRGMLKSQSSADLKSLLIRMVIFGIVIGAVLALAQMWQRAVFRYVHDPRRRYQFLLLRRITMWCAIGITIAFALATEIGSIATFAGLITAGVAVALQNVILAIAGYFFLIGKHGVRVGDRVQISGVTGDVVDVGLIRLHLMEIGGAETDRQPTGRIVIFSNAVVFQPTAGFYKQIPGTSFVWHQVTLTLAAETDYALAEKRLLGAVEKVYAEYREKIEQQHNTMERTLSLSIAVPKPRSRLRLTQTGLEVVIRYPVESESAAGVDEQIIRELLHSLDQPPKLRMVGTGTPNIQPVGEEHKVA